jgi:hypothetical protein
VNWRDFQASSDDLTLLDGAWEAVTNALRESRDASDSDAPDFEGSSALDAVTRALCAAGSLDRASGLLVIDTGPLDFRWAMLAIATELFDAVLISTMDSAGNTLQYCVPEDEPGELIHLEVAHPERYLGVTHSIAASRLLRHMTGAPAISLQAALSVARSRRCRAPWLTIVVPLLREDSLTDTLESILAQKSADNVEVLVMRASKAGCAAEETPLMTAPGAEPQISYIDLADQSPYEAMDAALQLANSDWVFFIGDGDTLSNAQVISSIKAEIDNSPEDCSLLYGDVRMLGDGPGAVDGEVYAGEFSYERLKQQNLCHQSIFYRLDALRKDGGFDAKYSINADWATNIKIWHGAGPRYCSVVVANFVRGGLSTTGWDTPFFEDLESIWAANLAQDA